MAVKLQSIINLPKVLLHDHLDGGIRAQTVIDLANEMNVLLPENSAQKLSQWFYAEIASKDFQRGLAIFAITCSVMQTEAALERVAYETISDAAKDNIIYIETRFCPHLHIQKGLTYKQVIDSVIRGLNRGRQEFGVEYGVLLCGIRNFKDEINLQIAQICFDYLGHGVIGYDFAGADIGFPLSNHPKTLSLLKYHHIPLTVYAGEAAGIDAIIEALDIGAMRIGHACTIFNNDNQSLIEETLQRIKNEQVHIEINISSNIAIGSVVDFASHPVKKLFDRGINLALNTDDRLLLNNTLSGEYYTLTENYGLGLKDIMKMNNNAMQSSFAAKDIKDAILRKLSSVR
ncbi:MAG TPA: adenosine deaminase [Lentisphaeria bacterium]|nr:MAG: adenosine deaminase [Lentisphaerae bacterium GWF2_38_69]HBM16811.1 adenosine deaminase [Lentisphaeria bacterium]